MATSTTALTGPGSVPRRYDDVPGTPIDHDDPLFFYGPKNAFGEFSQWSRSTLTVTKAKIAEVAGIPCDDPSAAIEGDADTLVFGCAEQFMMFGKAVRFGDRAAQRQILATADPAQQKRLGRLIRGFSDASWDAVKSDVVVCGSEAKFGQSAKLQRLLLSTGTRLLVEAAPRDRVWGIGYGKDSARANMDTWGENRLGWALMQARASLRAGAGGQAPGRGSGNVIPNAAT